MICQNCGVENRPDVHFCRHCGQRLSPPAVSPVRPSVKNSLESSGTAVLPVGLPAVQPDIEERSACPHCGMVVKPGARFCAHCGQPLQSLPVDLPQPPAQSLPYPVMQPLPAPPPTAPSPSNYAPLPPQALPPQPLMGEYPAYPPAVASTPLHPPQLPRARGRQLPGWLVWVLIGLALVAIIGVIVLLITSAPKWLNFLRTTTSSSSLTATLQPAATVAATASQSSPVVLQLTTTTKPWRGEQRVEILASDAFQSQVANPSQEPLPIGGQA